MVVLQVMNKAQVCTGMYHSLALDKSGAVWSKKNQNKSEPVKLDGCNGKINSISTGFKPALALSDNGMVYVQAPFSN